MQKINVDPNIWIIFKKTIDENKLPIIKFWGLTDDALKLASLIDKGWTAIRHGNDWEETSFPLIGEI